MPNQAPALDARQDELLSLMRTKGLSIKNLDETRKEELLVLLDYLHNTRGLSLNDIAKLVGNKTSGYTSWLCKQLGVHRRPFEEARLKGIREKRRKYERKPFNGTDEDKAYLLGLQHGDLSVSRPWKGVVRVSTNTTHPAMPELFRSLFEPYGHVYQHPRYKKDTKSYEWNLSTIVDDSFEFLFLELDAAKEWLTSSTGILLAYLSGLLDAEGSIITTMDANDCVALFVDYYNSDLNLIKWVQDMISKMGYMTSLRINKRKGVRTKKYGIPHRRDYWQLSTLGLPSAQSFLRGLDPKHEEKVRRMKIVLSVSKGEPYSRVSEEIRTLRTQIKTEVAQFIARAEKVYLTKHPVASSRN